MSEPSCRYCGNYYSKHTVSKHETKCFLRPENGKLLAIFLLRGLSNINEISRVKTYRFNIKNNIVTSYSIMNQTDSESWTDAIIKLILLFYEHKIIEDFETYDLLIGKITHWKFLENQKKYDQIRDYYYLKYHNIDIFFEIPAKNIEYLIMAIIKQAVNDYIFLIKSNKISYEENGIIIDVDETLSVIELLSPLIYEKITAQSYINEITGQIHD